MSHQRRSPGHPAAALRIPARWEDIHSVGVKVGGTLVTEADSREIAEARLLLARYLSDEVAPMIFADAAEILLKAPPEVMAREIHSWVGTQLQGPNASAVSDYLLHSARKVQNLGELGAHPQGRPQSIPGADSNRF